MPRALVLTTSNSSKKPAFDYNQSQVYFRDRFVPFSNANLSIASSPVLYGLSIYTVFSAAWDEDKQKLYIFRLQDHYKRLINSARIMDFHRFTEEWSYERFEATMTELLRRNSLREDVLVRVTVFIDELVAGTRIHGLKNSLSAYAYPLGEILPRSGVHLGVSSWQRTADNAVPSRAKVNGSYVNASLMKNEAILNGFDDAVALDEAGHVAESTVANIFIVRSGRLITPGSTSDILEGITRDSILTIAKDLAIPIEERSIDRSELYICDEAFLCGSSAGIVSILSIDKRPLNRSVITEKISEIYRSAQFAADSHYKHWLIAA